MGPGRKIVERCDGQRTVGEIIQELKAEFPSVEPGRIEAEVTTFLERLHQKRVIDLQ
jgi:coenzyme PQQ biosynthesis protein PqqD